MLSLWSWGRVEGNASCTDAPCVALTEAAESAPAESSGLQTSASRDTWELDSTAPDTPGNPKVTSTPFVLSVTHIINKVKTPLKRGFGETELLCLRRR